MKTMQERNIFLVSGFWFLGYTHKEIWGLKEETMRERVRVPIPQPSESSVKEVGPLPGVSCDCYRNDFPYAQQNSSFQFHRMEN